MAMHFAKRFRTARSLLLAAGLVPALAGCGGSGMKPTLTLDSGGSANSAVGLYDLGVSQLLLGKLDQAEQAFRSSLAVARRSGLDFAPPHEGMARVLLRRNDLDDAEAEAMHAQELDRFWTPVYWVLGKVAERQGNDEMALVHYQRGLISAPGDPELTAAAADLLTRLGREKEAKELTSRGGTGTAGREGSPKPPPSPENGGPAPGTGASAVPGRQDSSSGGLEERTRARLDPFFPDRKDVLTRELLAVFQQDFFTRGALAVLVTGDGEHGLAGALNRSRITEGASVPPGDTRGRPEASWINRALGMGILETFPDGTFRPDQVMTRLTLSLWIEETISRLRNDQRVFDLYRGMESPFPDIPAGHYGLNAARIVTDLGLMKTKSNGDFGLEDKVTMDEGIEAIRGLAPALLGQTR